MPKFYPMAQTALAPAAQFPDTLPPSAAIAYPFQVRRMAALIQPVIARRDVRFTTPTAIAISKKTPIGVTLPCGDVAEENTRPPEVANKTSGTQGGAGDQNRCDSDGDEEDGRTSPDVLSTSMRSNEDTWDFWDRVYSDPELRQSMQERQVAWLSVQPHPTKALRYRFAERFTYGRAASFGQTLQSSSRVP